MRTPEADMATSATAGGGVRGLLGRLAILQIEEALPILPPPPAGRGRRRRSTAAEKGPSFRDILKAYGREFVKRYPPSGRARSVLRNVRDCQTGRLGSYRDRCNTCPTTIAGECSCRNRHCPRCGGLTRALWVRDRKADLLPTPYLHVVVKLPRELQTLAMGNRRLMDNILLRAAQQTMKSLGADPRYLGAEVGGFVMLQTWAKDLSFDPHVHIVLPAGGLSPDRTRWVPWSKRRFPPTQAISRVFLDKLLSSVQRAYLKDELRFGTGTASLADPVEFAALLEKARRDYRQTYVSYLERGVVNLIFYLAEYVARVAITDERIEGLEDGRVTFTARDSTFPKQATRISIGVYEFLRRICLHIWPRGFHAIRHFGFFAPGSKTENLKVVRELLGVETADGEKGRRAKTRREKTRALLGRDPDQCPTCKKGRMVREILRPPLLNDSSEEGGWLDSS